MRADQPSSSTWSTDAPFSMSARTSLSWPLPAATSRAVLRRDPSWSTSSASYESSSCTTASCPYRHASISDVSPSACT
eukprot:1794809-Prymnesium_polylepis.1